MFDTSAVVRFGATVGLVTTAAQAAPPDHAIQVALISGGLAVIVALGTPLVREWIAARAARRRPPPTVHDDRDELIAELIRELIADRTEKKPPRARR